MQIFSPDQHPINRLGTPFCPIIKPLSPSNLGEELSQRAVAVFPLWEHGWLVNTVPADSVGGRYPKQPPQKQQGAPHQECLHCCSYAKPLPTVAKSVVVGFPGLLVVRHIGIFSKEDMADAETTGSEATFHFKGDHRQLGGCIFFLVFHGYSILMVGMVYIMLRATSKGFSITFCGVVKIGFPLSS